MKLADRVQRVPPSGIRRFFELAEEKDEVISLGVGEPDFSAPWAARTAAIDSLERGKTSYTANRGRRDLRRAIADHVTRYDQSYDPDEEVLVTTGASEAVDVAMRALVDPGDTVAVHQPSYISYVPGIVFAGGEPLSVPTRMENDFKLTYEDLEAAGAADADVLVFCYPNNPTGATMDSEDLVEVAEMRTQYNRRRQFVLSRFNEMGLDCFEAKGAFYAFPHCGGDDEAFAEELLQEQNVAVVPGRVFGEGGEGHLRVSYATGMNDLREALGRIETFVSA